MKNCKEECLKYLKYSRTEKEVFEYLNRENFKYEEIIEAISYAKELKYIDDYDYAKSFINDHIFINKWGPIKIKIKLKEKGFQDDDIDNLLSDYEDEIFSSLEDQLNNKINSFSEIDYKSKNKIIRYFLNKGYNYDIIKKAFDKYE